MPAAALIVATRVTRSRVSQEPVANVSTSPLAQGMVNNSARVCAACTPCRGPCATYIAEEINISAACSGAEWGWKKEG